MMVNNQKFRLVKTEQALDQTRSQNEEFRQKIFNYEK